MSDELRVAPCGHDAAQYAVERWHYSRSLPVPPRVVLGVWERGRFIGVVIYSRGASPELGARYGLSNTQVCELTRVALTSHVAPVTQIVAAAMRWLRARNPGMRLVVSFADPAHGHHGGIYQAGGWLYTGQTPASVQYRDKHGRVWHSRQVSSNGKRKQFGEVRRVVNINDCTAIKLPGKHRYLYPLDKGMRRKITPLARPYPRAVEASTVTHSATG